MSCHKKCNKCEPEKCVCHPCHNVKLGDCNTCDETPATTIPDCVNPVDCNEGCEEYVDGNCIKCGDTIISVCDFIGCEVDIEHSYDCNIFSISNSDILYGVFKTPDNLLITLSDGLSANLSAGTYEGHFFVKGACPVVYKEFIIEECDLCENPISNNSIEIENGIITINGLNIQSVTILGETYENGDNISLLEGVYQIAYNPLDINCNVEVSNYTYILECETPINNPSILINNNILTINGNNILSVTIEGGTYLNGSSIDLDAGTYTVTYNPSDIKCTNATSVYQVLPTCISPINNPSISITDGVLTILGDNVISVIIDGITYVNGETINLTPGNYTITHNPIDTECTSVTTQFIVDAVCEDPITNAFITIENDVINIFGENISFVEIDGNNYNDGDSITINAGTYVVSYYPTDSFCEIIYDNYEVEFCFPCENRLTLRNFEYAPIVNSGEIEITYDKTLYACPNTVITNETRLFTALYSGYLTEFNEALIDGSGFVNNLVLNVTNPMDLILVNFNPSTVLSTYPGLVINTSDLIYDASDPAKMIAALRTVMDFAINKYLTDNSITGEMYDYIIQITPSGTIEFLFQEFHLPTSPVITLNMSGTPNNLSVYPDGTTQFTLDVIYRYNLFSSNITETSFTECDQQLLTTYNIQGGREGGDSNYLWNDFSNIILTVNQTVESAIVECGCDEGN